MCRAFSVSCRVLGLLVLLALPVGVRAQADPALNSINQSNAMMRSIQNNAAGMGAGVGMSNVPSYNSGAAMMGSVQSHMMGAGSGFNSSYGAIPNYGASTMASINRSNAAMNSMWTNQAQIERSYSQQTINNAPDTLYNVYWGQYYRNQAYMHASQPIYWSPSTPTDSAFWLANSMRQQAQLAARTAVMDRRLEERRNPGPDPVGAGISRAENRPDLAAYHSVPTAAPTAPAVPFGPETPLPTNYRPPSPR